MKYILASASPRRRELLKMILPQFECIAPQFDEGSIEEKNAKKRTIILSREKCREIAQNNKDAVVIASDTVVGLDGAVLEKPKDKSEARNMIKSLSGRKHNVYSAFTVYCRGVMYSFAEATEVYMDKIPADTIERYIDTDEPYDKAGAYAIQGFIGRYIYKICGDYNNVVGLPVARLNRLLENINAI